MNYFQYIPEELKNTILTYSRYPLICQLSEELGLFTNYRKLLLSKYPINGMHIIKYINDDYQYAYKYLDFYDFDDDTDAFVHRRMIWLNKKYKEIRELVNRIYLENKYGSEFRLILDKFPEDDHKYIVIFRTIDNLRSDYLIELIFKDKPANKDNLDFNLLNNEFDTLNYPEIILLILALKFDLNVKEIESIHSFDDDNRYHRVDLIDDYEFNYISQVIEELNDI